MAGDSAKGLFVPLAMNVAPCVGTETSGSGEPDRQTPLGTSAD